MKNSAIEAILSRRSLRNYSDKKPSKEDLEIIMNCAIHAPTAWQREPWVFRVVQNKELLARLNETCVSWLGENQPEKALLLGGSSAQLFYGAPVMVIIAGDKTASFAAYDCTLATANALIAAQSLGIGSCVIGFVSELLKKEEGASLCKELKIPNGYQVHCAFALGYAANPRTTQGRRDSSKICYL